MFRFFVSKVVRYLLSRLSIGKVLKRDKILFGQVIQTVPMLALVPAALCWGIGAGVPKAFLIPACHSGRRIVGATVGPLTRLLAG